MNKLELPENLASKKVILCREDPFFISPQGEGKYMGRLSAWIRTSTCNLRCFAPDQLVTMSNGARKQIQDIIEGDILGTIKVDGKQSQYVEAVVKKAWKTPLGNRKLIKFTLEDGNELTVTEDHRLYGRGSDYYVLKKKSLAQGWHEAMDFEVNDELVVLDIPDFQKTIDWYHGYMCGAIYGDGSITGEDYVSFASVDKSFTEALSNSIQKITGYNYSPVFLKRQKKHHQDLWVLRYKNIAGLKVVQKYKEEWFYSRDFNRGFIAGFFDAEGTYTKSHNMYVTQTTDPELMDKIGSIISSFGFRVSSTSRKTNAVKSGIVYNINILGTKPDRVRFYKCFQPQIKRKFKIPLSASNIPGIKTKIISKEIIVKEPTFEVYDLETSTETLLVGNVLSHNCAWLNPSGEVTLCDTAYTSHKPERNFKTALETYTYVMDNNCPHVVITGGEPSQQETIVDLIDWIEDSGKRVTVETNGTNFFTSKATLISMSPKLASSSSGLKHLSNPDNIRMDTDSFFQKLFFPDGNLDKDKLARMYQKNFETHEKGRYNLDSMRKFMEYYGPDRYQFKFVANSEEDIQEIIEKYKEPLNIPNDNIWLMPQGISHAQLNQRAAWIAEKCKELGWSYSDRIHIRIWGNKTGV